jgi:hypothetical protein
MENQNTVTGQQPKLDLIRKEELAAQIVAIMQADFRRPGPEEMKEVLRCAEGQITAQEWLSAPSLAT